MGVNEFALIPAPEPSLDPLGVVKVKLPLGAASGVRGRARSSVVFGTTLNGVANL